MRRRGIDTSRVLAAIAVIGALIAALATLSPAIGGDGTLTVRAAKKLFLQKQAAKRKFLKKKAADKRFLTAEEADASFLTPAEGAAQFEPGSGTTRINFDSNAWVVNEETSTSVGRDSSGLGILFDMGGTARLWLSMPVPVTDRGAANSVVGLEVCFMGHDVALDSLRLYGPVQATGSSGSTEPIFAENDNTPVSGATCLDYGASELGSLVLGPNQVLGLELNPDVTIAPGFFRPMRTTLTIAR